MTQLKVCRSCQQEKENSLEFFPAHKNCRDGIDTQCRDCSTAYQTSWRAENRAKLLEGRRAHYHATKGLETKKRAADLKAARVLRQPVRQAAIHLASGVRNRSSENDLELSQEMRSRAFFEAWLTRQPRCECCDAEFDLGPKNGMPKDRSPSIDRFDTWKGYTIENSALVCWRCNNIKRNYAADDLRLVASWMDRRSTKFSPAPEMDIAA